MVYSDLILFSEILILNVISNAFPLFVSVNKRMSNRDLFVI